MKITTRFCGIDVFSDDCQSPFVFETIITGGIYHGEEQKYNTKAKAIEGHTMICLAISNMIV